MIYSATEAFILSNFAVILATLLYFLATLRLYLLSRDASWDGWRLLTISMAVLTVSSLVYFVGEGGFLGQAGAGTADLRAGLSAAAGLLAASAFIMSSRLIRKSGARK